MEPSDYSYFNKILMRTWAGPAHWRIAPASRPAPGDDSQAKAQRRRQKKQALRLTYETAEAELDKMFKLSKATAVTKATWSKYTKKRTTLPEDQRLDSQDRLFRLFHRPQLMIKRQSGDSIGLDDGIENYDYNNRNDVENFCPVVRDDEVDADYSGGFDLSSETNFPQASQNDVSQQSALSNSGLNGTILTQDKLVAAPHRVEKIDIKYAKAAKRVDVRKLKTTMWSIMSQDKLPTPEMTTEPVDQSLSAEETPMKMLIPYHFNLLRDVLPSHVSVSMAKNLTIQTVFACLLYITNEKTLKLTSCETMDDIIIQQDNCT